MIFLFDEDSLLSVRALAEFDVYEVLLRLGEAQRALVGGLGLGAFAGDDVAFLLDVVGLSSDPNPTFSTSLTHHILCPRSRRAATRRGRFETLFDSYANLPHVRLSSIVAEATKPP